MANPFVHVELNTTDVAAAKSFYGKLFDWQLEDVPMPSGSYTMIKVGSGTGGGMMKHPVPGAPSAWLPYVECRRHCGGDEEGAVARRQGHAGCDRGDGRRMAVRSSSTRPAPRSASGSRRAERPPRHDGARGAVTDCRSQTRRAKVLSTLDGGDSVSAPLDGHSLSNETAVPDAPAPARAGSAPRRGRRSGDSTRRSAPAGSRESCSSGASIPGRSVDAVTLSRSTGAARPPRTLAPVGQAPRGRGLRAACVRSFTAACAAAEFAESRYGRRMNDARSPDAGAPASALPSATILGFSAARPVRDGRR